MSKLTIYNAFAISVSEMPPPNHNEAAARQQARVTRYILGLPPPQAAETWIIDIGEWIANRDRRPRR